MNSFSFHWSPMDDAYIKEHAATIEEALGRAIAQAIRERASDPVSRVADLLQQQAVAPSPAASALSLDDAIQRFPCLGGGQRAVISMKVFSSPDTVATYVAEVCRCCGCGVDANGRLTDVHDAASTTYMTRFVEACAAQGDEVVKRMDKDSKARLRKLSEHDATKRYEALVRAVYALGHAIGQEGELLPS